MRIVSFLNSFLRRISIAGAALLAFSPAALWAQGNTPSAADGFDPNVNGIVYATAIQPDGKILIAGNFTLVKPNETVGAFRNNIARINADGSLDSTFDPNVNGPISALVLLSDGRILIGGSFTSLQPLQPNGTATVTSRTNLAMLKSDGTLDPSFSSVATTQLFNPSSAKTQIKVLAVQSADGKIILGGQFTTRQLSNGTDDPTTRNYLARLNADGSLDTTFNPNPNAVVLTLALSPADPNTKRQQILFGGGFTTLQPPGAATATTYNYIARLNYDGTPDTAFAPNPNASVTCVAYQPDGQILAGGYFATLQPAGTDSAVNHSLFTRLNKTDGSPDTTFVDPNPNGQILSILIQNDGKIVLGGTFTSIAVSTTSSQATYSYCARLKPDGTLDDVFKPSPNYIVDTIALQTDGKLVIGGNFTQLRPNGAINATQRNRIARLNTDGSLDTSLDPNAANRIQCMAVQPLDHKVLIGGLSFTSIGGQTRNGIARLNPDATLDTTFNPNVNSYVLGIAVQADQKIIIVGTFTALQPNGASLPTTSNYIARLNADGTVDSTFTNPNPNNQIAAVVIQSDGKILLGGSFTAFTSSDGTTTTTANYIARLNTDGSLDTTFSPGGDKSVAALAIQSDGKILAVGYFSSFYSSGATTATAHTGIVRLNSTDGTVDTTFNAHANPAITTLALQSDGKIVVGGPFTQAFGSNDTVVSTRNYIARFNADGSLDAGFDPNANGPVIAVAVQPSDGKILLGGLFTTIQPNGASDWTQRYYIARVNTDGTTDTSFDPDANHQLRALLVRSDSGYAGKILVAGGFTTLQPNGGAITTLSLPIAQLNTAGTIDNGFVVSAGGPIGSQANALAVQPNGRIVVGGIFPTLAGSPSSNLTRFNTDNSTDNFFTPTPDAAVNAVAVLSNNNGITSPIQGFAWLNPDGSLLPSSKFQPNSVVQLLGSINTIVRQKDTGQILVGGLFTNQSGATGGNLVRLNADGGLDVTFDPEPDGAVYAVIVRSDSGHVGQIIVAGAFATICGQTRNHIAQLNSNGTLDTSFDPNASDLVDVLLQQADGKILFGGAFTSLSPNGATTATSIQYLARLNADGTLDTAFQPTPDNQVSSLAIQPADGKIVVGGVFSNFSPNSATTATKRISIARLNSDGTLDPGFDPNGSGNVLSLVVQPDGMILMGGNFQTVGGWQRNGIARLQTNGNLDEHFDPSANGQVSSIAVQTDGSILVAGSFSGISNVTRARLARLYADGSLDLSFDPSPDDQVNRLSLQDDGTIMIGGFFTAFRSNGTLLAGGAFNNIGGLPTKHLALLRDDGNVDSSFQPNPDGTVNALLLQTDGSFVVGGDFTHIAGVACTRLARFLTNADGSHTFDSTFNAPAPLGAVTALTLQADGKILVGAPFTSGVPTYASLARLNSNGTLDTTFQPGLLGAITALAVQPDGRVLAANAAQAAGVPAQPGRVVRLNTDGSRDTSFNAYANDKIATLALQIDGRIVIGGVFTTVNGVARNRLARLNADGTLDTTFDPNANDSVNALVIQPDGKVLVGGAFSLVSSQGRYLLARIAATSVGTQSLKVSSDHTTITWLRTGTGPELSGAVFDQSTDSGVTWTSLGKASRVSGTSNWQLNGLHLTSALVYVRARGLVLTSQNGSAHMIELYWQFLLSTVSGTDYTGTAMDLAGSTTTSGTTSGQSTIAFGSTISASSVTDAGTGTQQSDAATAAGRFISLSARATVSNGYPLITGFVISGSGQKSVLLRAVGPGLSGLVPAPLAAPRMQVYTSATPLLSVNTGWDGSSSLIAVINRLGALPLKVGSADAATLMTLSPGSYTVVVPDGQGSGTVLAEVYDADASTATGAVRFTGLSARAQVTVDDPLIAGLAVSGNTARRVLLRGWGPALTASNVSGALSDPILAVYDGQDQLLAQNDNWQNQTTVNSTQTLGSVSDVVSACTSVFVSGSKDSALIITLAPGTYTIQISGVNHTAGAAMVEAYDLSP
jgi:uncharacterized delta-60 repeat protein